MDSQHPHHGPARQKAQNKRDKFRQEVAPTPHEQNCNWVPGDAPTQGLEWAIETLKKAGRLSIIGVYLPQEEMFPIGKVMNKNLTLKMGNCNHHTLLPHLLKLVSTGAIDPDRVPT